MSPFFGLSVVVHVVVIAWHKTVSFLFPNRVKRQIVKPHLISQIFAVLTIFAVLSFVVFCGATILYASVIEKHSTVYAVERYAPEVAEFNYAGSYTKIVSVLPSLSDLNLYTQPSRAAYYAR